ncbi:MAG: hypothetical protein ACREK5_09925 [Gemmatimonadota bacterium]
MRAPVGAVLLLLATAVAAPGQDDRADSIEVQVLWAGPGVDLEGTLSADGRFLSFVDWSTGDLAVRDLRRGESRRITHKGGWSESGEFAGPSAISPDGERVAFAWFRADGRYDLRVVEADGSDLRILLDDEAIVFARPAGWSPDGRSIVTILDRADGSSLVVVVSAKDASVRALGELGGVPRLSPDGRFLAYDGPSPDRAPLRDVHVLAMEEDAPLPITSGPANNWAPQWTPDGAGVAFLSDRSGSVDLWLQPMSDGRPAGEPRLLRRAIGPVRPLGFSTGGDFIFAARVSARAVYMLDLDPVARLAAGAPRLVSEAGEDAYSAPAWSPEGRRLAYIALRDEFPDGPGQRIFAIRPVADGEAELLSPRGTSTGRHAAPSWSPDGRSLVHPGCGFLCWIDARTGEATAIPGAGGRFDAWSPAVSPHGEEIFFLHGSALGRGYALRAVDPRTGVQRELHRGPVSAFSLSPDGSRVALVEPDSTGTTLSLIGSAGGTARVLLHLDTPSTSPGSAGLDWTPDGRLLLFPRRQPEGSALELWALDVGQGEAHPLGLAMEGLAQYGLDVHPDGGAVAFTAGRARWEVRMLPGLLRSE